MRPTDWCLAVQAHGLGERDLHPTQPELLVGEFHPRSNNDCKTLEDSRFRGTMITSIGGEKHCKRVPVRSAWHFAPREVLCKVHQPQWQQGLSLNSVSAATART